MEVSEVRRVGQDMGESLLQEERVHHFPVLRVYIGQETMVGILFQSVKLKSD
jgi:hypothetical protein